MLNAKLMHAAASGNVKDVKKLLLKGALFTKDQDGNTALHEASRNGYAEVVQLLLKASCYADSYNSHGMNSLHLAAQHGHASVVKTLLKHKANPLLANKHGETALHIASKFSQPEVIGAFSECDTNMNVMMENGDTALHVAAKYGNLSVLRTLLVAESDPFIRNKEGWLACEVAEKCGQTEAKVLLECLMQEKCKSYRPQSMQQQRDPPLGRSRQVDTTEGDVAKRRKSKLFSSFKTSFTRLRLSSTSSSVAATVEDESSNEAGDFLNGETAKKSGNDRASENGRVAATHFDRSPTRRPRSIQFSDTEVVNRTYESVDEVASKVSFYKRPVTAQLPPTPRTGPPQLEQQRESVDEYVVMAPSLRRRSGSYGSQWDTVSVSSKQGATRSILHSTSSTSSCSPTAPINLQDELDTMRQAFEIRLIQLEKRYQRHLAKVETPPSLPAPRPRLPTWGPSSTQESVHNSSLYHSRRFSSALRCGPVGEDMRLSANQSLPFAASSSYLPGVELEEKSSSVFKRSESADLLKVEAPLEGRLLRQRDRFSSGSADRITSLAGSIPLPPSNITAAPSDPSPVMIDDTGLLSGDSDDSLIESLLNAQIGPLPEPGPDSKRPWFDANTCDDGDSVAPTDVTVISGKNDSLNNSFQSSASGHSGKEGNGLLKWVPRQEAKSKLKEKLKAHKQKSLEQQQIRQCLGEGQKIPPTTTHSVPAKTDEDGAVNSNLHEKIKKLEGIIKEQKQTLV